MEPPDDDGSDGDCSHEGFDVAVEAGCDAAELLEFAEAAFDQVALCVEVLVERVLAGSGGVVWDDGECALVGYGLTELVDDLTVHRLPRATHWLAHEEPDEVARLIFDFIGR